MSDGFSDAYQESEFRDRNLVLKNSVEKVFSLKSLDSLRYFEDACMALSRASWGEYEFGRDKIIPEAWRKVSSIYHELEIGNIDF
ncbi:MAG: hypothetical protein PVJ67_02640 [Candidatus Pacearchaeota archaeon]|jgi:hypothetical protein